MRFLATILMFTGYALVYASVANHGSFAKDPWKGLFADAYTFNVIVGKNNPTTSGTTGGTPEMQATA